jgi:co-chaperonin GroES (HSP10)
MPKGKWGNTGGYSDGDRPWLNAGSGSKPSIQDVRTGKVFGDGADRKVRNTDNGKYVAVTHGPRETAKIVRELRAQGQHVIVEKVQDVQYTDGGTGCMIFMLAGLGSIAAATFEVVRYIW